MLIQNATRRIGKCLSLNENDEKREMKNNYK